MERIQAGMILAFLLVFSAFSNTVPAQKFLKDDPLWEDNDRIPINKPLKIELSQISDFLKNTFLYRPEGEIAESENINTLGEVPNSTWFTNRIGVRDMTIEELVRGPNTVDGPDLSRIEISAPKAEGITPGFTARDGRGDVYLFKFDPLDYPQMATSTEVISTKFFHAFGYHVPENYLIYVHPDDIQIAADAEVEHYDTTRPMTRDDLNYLLRRVPRRPDGTVQVLASRFLEGTPLGPFVYIETRKDDANDVFPHENRRELRGLQVFSAWLNHDDSRSVNSLDTFIEEGERGYVRHHLIDFGSTLGSGSIEPQSRRGGNEYRFDGKPILKAGLSLGIWDREWRKIKYPNYPAIGNFESEYFQPDEWKPEYPNPAFERMQMQDAFWAAKIVQRFSEKMIRAIVKTGEITDSEAENYLAETLIKRRDKVVRYYLSLLNPLDRFEVSSNDHSLRFQNLGLVERLAPDARYQYRWFRFDNATEKLEEIGSENTVSTPQIPIPQEQDPFLMVRIRTIAPGQPAWNQKVDVYLRNTFEREVPEVVGIERETRP